MTKPYVISQSENIRLVRDDNRLTLEQGDYDALEVRYWKHVITVDASLWGSQNIGKILGLLLKVIDGQA